MKCLHCVGLFRPLVTVVQLPGGGGLGFYIGNSWDKFITSIVLCTRVCKMTEYKVKVCPGFLFCFHFQVPFLGLDNCPSVTLMVALH